MTPEEMDYHQKYYQNNKDKIKRRSEEYRLSNKNNPEYKKNRAIIQNRYVSKYPEKENAELRRKYNIKTQQIGDKLKSNNNFENISVKKDNQFEEDL